MGYQIVTATLNDGRKFEMAISGSQIIGEVRGHTDIPFDPEEIAAIEAVPDWSLRRNAHKWWS
jgi:hypothetical protein